MQSTVGFGRCAVTRSNPTSANRLANFLIRAEPIKPVLPVTMIVSLHSAIRVRLSSCREAGFCSSPFAPGVHNLRHGGSQVPGGYGVDYRDWSPSRSRPRPRRDGKLCIASGPVSRYRGTPYRSAEFNHCVAPYQMSVAQPVLGATRLAWPCRPRSWALSALAGPLGGC